MNKVLVTGLALGKDAGLCDACNFDYDWLIKYPSVLLWADRILIPATIWRIIQEEEYPTPKELAKCCRLILDMAQAHGLVEVVQTGKVVDDRLRKAIPKQIGRDVEQIQQLFPGIVEVKSLAKDGKGGPNAVVIEGKHFCGPYLNAIYGSLVAARAWDANCLFDEAVFQFLRCKFGIAAFPEEADRGRLESFVTVFRAFFPNDSLIPKYAVSPDIECGACKDKIICKSIYLKDVELQVTDILKWRDYDEIQQARAVLDSIIKKHGKSSTQVDPKEVAASFANVRGRLAKRTRSVFPKVRRWANLATVMSVPIAVAGLAMDASLITIAGAGVAGLAKVSTELTELLESKYQWVGFLQRIQQKGLDTTGG